MKPAMLCLLLLSACELEAGRNWTTYKLTWSCQSSGGCERTEQVTLIDRATIVDSEGEFMHFESSRTDFSATAQKFPSDELPANCSWLYGLELFAYELEPSRFCHTSGGFELELSIPNRDPTTHSNWLVEARETDE